MERFLFSDEAGDLTFNRNANTSRYFIICTMLTDTLEMGEALIRLRHDLIRKGETLGDCFHATTDTQTVRDRVYETMLHHEFQFQATICEKSKAQPQVTVSKARFYKIPWFFHFRHGVAPKLKPEDTLVVTAASIGTRKERLTYTNGLRDVVDQSSKGVSWAVDFRPALSDPMLQASDYCAWAVQRSWERGDNRSLNLIRDRMSYSYDLWRRGTTHYY